MFFFFNDTATTEIYTLSLHDALPISERGGEGARPHASQSRGRGRGGEGRPGARGGSPPPGGRPARGGGGPPPGGEEGPRSRPLRDPRALQPPGPHAALH